MRLTSRFIVMETRHNQKDRESFGKTREKGVGEWGEDNFLN